MTDLWGNAILLKYLDNLILLPIYQKIMVMYIYCLRDVYATPCSICIADGRIQATVRCRLKTVKELDEIDLQLRDH